MAATPHARPAPPRAVISLGTNSTRLLIAAHDDPTRALEQRTIGTRLGEGLRERGELAGEAMRRTLAAVEAHLARARAAGAEVAVIATSAMRRASNGDVFRARVRELTASDPAVLSGEDEARYSYLGAVATVAGSAGARRYAVVDIGGGSTEFALGTRRTVEATVSCEVGAVRLTEVFPVLREQVEAAVRPCLESAARDYVDERLEPIPREPSIHEAIVVGGTATTSAAMLRDLDRERLGDDLTVDLDELRRLLDALLARDLERRLELPRMVAQRADILPAGVIIVQQVLRRLGRPRFRLARGDLLLGYLLAGARGVARTGREASANDTDMTAPG